MTPESISLIFIFALVVGFVGLLTYIVEDVLGWHFDIDEEEDRI